MLSARRHAREEEKKYKPRVPTLPRSNHVGWRGDGWGFSRGDHVGIVYYVGMG